MFKLPFMITCAALEDLILSYLDDELTPWQKFVFETHITICHECRDYLRAYQVALEIVRSVLKDEQNDYIGQDTEVLINGQLASRKS